MGCAATMPQNVHNDFCACAPGGQRPILVVDDDRLVRNVIARMLKECDADFVVELAENGVDGCIRIPVFRPHLKRRT